uniref:Malonyl-CoA decarboxylase n=1 Tax=Rhizophora mucronata TaxID=61149 RepID=A0A2P2LML8_RHIMU
MKIRGSPGIAGCKYPKQRRPMPSLLLRSKRLLIGCTAS